MVCRCRVGQAVREQGVTEQIVPVLYCFFLFFSAGTSFAGVHYGLLVAMRSFLRSSMWH